MTTGEQGPGDPAPARLILDSDQRLTGGFLVPAGVDDFEAVRWLHEAAPFFVSSPGSTQ